MRRQSEQLQSVATVGVEGNFNLTAPQWQEPWCAHFSDRGRLFQADRGRRFSAIVDARGMRASVVFNVSQSSTISLKRGLDGPLSMRPQGVSWG